MPIYVYICRNCGQEFERLTLSATRADEATCPFCGSREVERRPALFGLGGGNRSASPSGGSCRPATTSGG